MINTSSEELRKKIGKELAATRKSKGMTQAGMAEAISKAMGGYFSQRAVQDYELGKMPIFPSKVVQVIDDLLGTDFYGQLYNQAAPRARRQRKKTATAPADPIPQAIEDLAYSCRKNADSIAKLVATITEMKEDDRERSRSLERLLEQVIGLLKHSAV